LIRAVQVSGFIAQHNDRYRARQSKARGDGHRALGHGDIASAQQVPGADREHEDRTHHIAGGNGMHELGLRDRVEQHRAERGQFHAHGVVVEFRPDRMLHPTVGNQDPERRKTRTQRHERGDEQVGDF
jgi:hypothetical protein